MRARCTLIALSLVTAGCGDAHIIHIGTAEGVVISAEKASQLLEPCSRERPARADDYWVPGVEDLRALEQMLPQFLESNLRSSGPRFPDLGTYKRQYVGIVRGGRRSIYVNVFPDHPVATPEWTTDPVIVCDGGAQFFGAEFDLASGQFTHVAYNGVG